MLADLILGHQPMVAIEWDHYCCEVLREKAEDGWFPGLHVFEGDARLFPASDWAGRVDCIHAGFPCQPFSLAGSRKGSEDERDMWPITLDTIRTIQPKWVFLENVPGLVSWNGGERVAHIVGELAGLGYMGSHGVLGAVDVGAPHRRKRWWLLARRADTTSSRRRSSGSTIETILESKAQQRFTRLCGGNVADSSRRRCGGEKSRKVQQSRRAETVGAGEDVPDTDHQRIEWWKQQQKRSQGERDLADTNNTWQLQSRRSEQVKRGRISDSGRGKGEWWATESDVGRVANGVASRVDRIKALGNGQVPLQAALAWVMLGGPL
jgi:DNA (cytosine-5)-methyltransferase 1